ncbi:coproporphyrinogen III oxidase [Tieghemostelium lacteum]|uniref:coproporphyrinogen oxidase n=1 Tax=Tieghemostelium lacteum TaxID=361077 RepID=A0A151Z3V7_TIELA|nr:coproporphyrinogen III oxidase [Tieghemostelium lacteum]|eukprot:KYQ88484.1 coproporphyrinogen III oxidase [Tieghemostelium lacteum]
MSTITSEKIRDGLKEVQNAICKFLIEETSQNYNEDLWDYHKGKGGGITRVWEGNNDENFYLQKELSSDASVDRLEKAGVNFSFIEGTNMPSSAVEQLKIAPDTAFIATGVSLVIHPYSPWIPTIHMNVRYFEAGDRWWFGGGVDLTPVYPQKDKVIQFHKTLKALCDRHHMPELKISYTQGKEECDKYFYLKHRDECRGVGGLFFDQLTSANIADRDRIWDFIHDMGMTFIQLYKPFLEKSIQLLPYTKEQREFQLYRRSRYVEFNLLFDRGTKFGIMSEGRTESILMSLPAVAKWKYNFKPTPNTPESELTEYYLKPKNWVDL